MVELGWAGIPFPEEHGGLAFGYKGLGVVTEETGTYPGCEPAVRDRLGGRHRDQHRWQRRSESERCCRKSPRVSCCWPWRWKNPIVTALMAWQRAPPNPAVDWQVLNGEQDLRLDGHVADKLIVAARTSGSAGDRDGITLFWSMRRPTEWRSPVNHHGRLP